MFEHLGCIPETTIKKKRTKLSIYLSALLAGIIVFVVSLGISSGSGTIAQDEGVQAKIFVNNENQVVVAQDSSFSLFDFGIEVDKEVVLQRLRVYINGLYEPSILANLKLYHGQTQLGHVIEVDESGYVYFEIDDYKLAAGKNLFYFKLIVDGLVDDSKVLQFILEDATDIVLSYQDRIVLAHDNFPLLGSTTFLVNSGDIVAYNTLEDNDFTVVSNTGHLVGSFSLANEGETVDISGISLACDCEELVLVKGKEIIAQAKVADGIANFKLGKALVLNNVNDLKLQVYTTGLPVGEFNFQLVDVVATGFNSGEKVNLSESIGLSTVNVVNYYPEFSNGELHKNLVEGWNELYNLKVVAKGEVDLNLDKLTWSVDAKGAKVKDTEVWIDNEKVNVEIVYQDGKLVVKSIPVSREGIDIKMLVKVSDIEDGAIVQARLLGDEVDTDNIVWSYEDQEFNSYNLPYLPLDPGVLTN